MQKREIMNHEHVCVSTSISKTDLEDIHITQDASDMSCASELNYFGDVLTKGTFWVGDWWQSAYSILLHKKQLIFGWVREVLVVEIKKNGEEIVLGNYAEQLLEFDLYFALLKFLQRNE